MAIEFKCSTCGKDLFAQDQYAGMRTTCPGCQSKMPIPFPPAAPNEVTPEEPIHAAPPLIDMEKIEPVAPDGVPTKAVANEAMMACPMCAETIRAAARKCRFCGEILDDDLKQENAQARRDAAVIASMTAASRADAVLRAVSILATMLTTGWLTLQTLNCIVLNSSTAGLTFQAPWPLYAFNVLLIIGLFSLIRHMRKGPYHIFLAAAISIVVCMPLDIWLGLPIQGMEQFMAEAKKQEFYKDWTLPQFYSLFAVVTGLVGGIISIPVWLTALKLGFQERMSGPKK